MWNVGTEETQASETSTPEQISRMHARISVPRYCVYCVASCHTSLVELEPRLCIVLLLERVVSLGFCCTHYKSAYLEAGVNSKANTVVNEL